MATGDTYSIYSVTSGGEVKPIHPAFERQATTPVIPRTHARILENYVAANTVYPGKYMVQNDRTKYGTIFLVEPARAYDVHHVTKL